MGKLSVNSAATVILSIAIISCAAAKADSVLRFENSNYEVPEGATTFVATIVYDLETIVVGDSFFDLSAEVDSIPGTGAISISSAARSTPTYLYDPALAGSGVFNPLPANEFQINGGILQANQGANDPVGDMSLPGGTYAYADVTFSISGAVGSVFNLTFSNYVLDDENASPLPLSADGATITIVPEPSTATIFLALTGMTLLRRKPSV